MGRPFYPHEADDPDLDWLVSNFLYERPDFQPIETGILPLVLIPYHDEDLVVIQEEEDLELYEAEEADQRKNTG